MTIKNGQMFAHLFSREKIFIKDDIPAPRGPVKNMYEVKFTAT